MFCVREAQEKMPKKIETGSDVFIWSNRPTFCKAGKIKGTVFCFKINAKFNEKNEYKLIEMNENSQLMKE